MLAHAHLEERTADTWTFTVDPPVGQRLALFLPFADIWTHQRVIVHFAHTWSRDNEIHLVKCDGLRQGACPAQRALKLDDSTPLSERRRICERCKSVSGLSCQVPTIDLATFETPPVALPTTLTEPLNFTLRSHPFGRIAIYEYLLTTKRSSEELGQDDSLPVSSAIQDAVGIYHKLRAIFERIEHDVDPEQDFCREVAETNPFGIQN